MTSGGRHTFNVFEMKTERRDSFDIAAETCWGRSWRAGGPEEDQRRDLLMLCKRIFSVRGQRREDDRVGWRQTTFLNILYFSLGRVDFNALIRPRLGEGSVFIVFFASRNTAAFNRKLGRWSSRKLPKHLSAVVRDKRARPEWSPPVPLWMKDVKHSGSERGRRKKEAEVPPKSPHSSLPHSTPSAATL